MFKCDGGVSKYKIISMESYYKFKYLVIEFFLYRMNNTENVFIVRKHER